MNQKNRWPRALALVLCFGLVPAVGYALPGVLSASAEDDDATISVSVYNQAITNDARSRCTVRIVVGGADVEFVSGDSVNLRVIESDLLSNDTIWETSFNVTSDEVRAQRVDRSFDCSSNFGTDGVGDTELFAEAEVVKDECGTFCAYDRPETDNLDIAEVEDDDQDIEDANDDAPAQAVTVAAGARPNRINRDQDWQTFTVATPSNITVEVGHGATYGRLDVALFDASNTRLAEGQDLETATTLQARNLAGGTYFVRISPRQSNDYNFYDFNLAVDGTGAVCNPGQTEDEACGNCGTRARTCDQNGQWGAFGECGAQGECSPGEARSNACGNCGSQMEMCNDACQWGGGGACMDEGECERGVTETQDCDGGGVQTRACGDTCEWGEFTACEAQECNDGDTQDCYEGPNGTEGVGVCRPGRQRCEGGAWGACQGQSLPANEQCADRRDNDCDGQTDSEDDACASEGAELGSACADSSECASDLLCLEAPEHPQFVDGYCGDDDCGEDADCGADGVCAEVFGGNFCLQVCAGAPDCRRGYLCAQVTPEARACVPRCTSDEDCGDIFNPVCNQDSGLCEPGEPGENNSNNEGPNNFNNENNSSENNSSENNASENNSSENNASENNSAGNNAAENNSGAENNGANNLNTDTGSTPPPADEGCGQAPGRATGWAGLGLLALGALALRRRRA
jgi:hypothetical protein